MLKEYPKQAILGEIRRFKGLQGHKKAIDFAKETETKVIDCKDDAMTYIVLGNRVPVPEGTELIYSFDSRGISKVLDINPLRAELAEMEAGLCNTINEESCNLIEMLRENGAMLMRVGNRYEKEREENHESTDPYFLRKSLESMQTNLLAMLQEISLIQAAQKQRETILKTDAWASEHSA